MPGLPTLAEKLFVVLSLFFSTTALIPVLLDSGDASGSPPDPYSPLLFMGIYAVTILLIARQWSEFVRVATKDLWIWLLVGIAVASMFWTVAPDITPRRGILLLGTSLFGAYIAMRFSLREQLQMLAWAMGMVVILSFVFAIALPFYGVMSVQEGGIHTGAWRGILTHKNLLGRLMVLSCMVFMFISLSNRTPNRWIMWTGYGLSIALIILSTSKTAIIALIVLTITLQLYRSWRLNYSQLIPLSIAIVLVVGGSAILAFDNIDVIAAAVGRDLTLTGRTEIWQVMLDKIAERPLFGYGFNAFWRDWDNPVTAEVWRLLAWECPYGHNGFMDLLAELGISGLVAFLCSYVITFVKGVNCLRTTRNIESIWHLVYVTFLLIYNISESTLVATNSIFWILYISTVFSLCTQSEELPYGYMTRVTEEEWLELEESNN